MDTGAEEVSIGRMEWSRDGQSRDNDSYAR